MSCFGGSTKGGGVQQVNKLTPEQEKLVGLLAQKATPAIQAMPSVATVPGQEFAPSGAAGLQQQAFNFAGGLPSYLQNSAFGNFNPNQITSAMKPVSDYAQNMFQQRTIPSIMSALGNQGSARSSGAADILAREGSNLSANLAAQFAPMQYQGLQAQLGRQAALPGIAGQMSGQLAGLGQQQRGIGEQQRQYGLQNFLAQAPEASPLLGLVGPAFTSAYDTAVQQGQYVPGIGTQLLNFGGKLFGG